MAHRHIVIDNDTKVGYNYLKKQFYVENKETITYRNTANDTLNVLKAINATEYTPDLEQPPIEITLEVIQALKDTEETLDTIYYTWQDTGAYISSVEFNEFDKYPLILDLEKQILYIQSSTVLINLTSNESPKVQIVPKLCSFYHDILGLYISEADMLDVYNTLINYYSPTCYNQIAPRTDEEKETNPTLCYYNNNIVLSDYQSISRAKYSCTLNPRNITTNKGIGNIVSLNTTNNIITLADPISLSVIIDEGTDYTITENIGVGSTVYITDLTETIDGIQYSANGIYTISNISDDFKEIEVAEALPISYEVYYPECKAQMAKYTIKSMTRDTNTIELNENPTNLLVGDTIEVQGAIVPEGLEQAISLNGSYTINAIKENIEETITTYNIIVEEDIKTDFNGEGATLTKELPISTIYKIENNAIYLTEKTDINLENKVIIVYNKDIRVEKTVTNQDPDGTTLTVNSIDTFNPDYHELKHPTSSSEMKIDVTYVAERFEDIFPIGEFIVDNFEQARAYLLLLQSLQVIEDNNADNIYKQVPTTMTIGNYTAKFKGLYTEVYGENSIENSILT